MVVLSPRISGLCNALLAQSADAFNRLEEFTNNLLHILTIASINRRLSDSHQQSGILGF